jgi:adenylate kinase family enzyme
MTTTPTMTLEQAMETLVAVAGSAGVQAETARAEGSALAAAVAESAPGAAADWATAVGGGTTQDFFDAATRGRRWRASPTATLGALVAQGSPFSVPYAEALAEVVSAACSLGEPTMRVVGNASVAAAAQLRAAGVPNASRSATSSFSAPTDPASAGPPEPDRQLTRGAFERAAGAAHPGQEPKTADPELKPKTYQELLDELDALIGLQQVKREIHRQVAILKIQRLRDEADMKKATITRHLVFTGNPGTGKTTVARLVSGIYTALDLLTQGQLIEADRSELVGGFLGQTSIKTSEVVAKAAGGVLFIDEAYSLAGDDYGNEAIDTLVKDMEDRREDLVVIVAGYPAPMEAFIAANPGLASRFRTTIEFADYTDDELVKILELLAEASDYEFTPEALTHFRELLGTTPRGEGFGNGRFSRNTLEAAIGAHAWRLRDAEAPTRDQLRQLLPQDLDQDPGEDPGKDQDKDTSESPSQDPGQDPGKDTSESPSQDLEQDLDQDEQGDPT